MKNLAVIAITVIVCAIGGTVFARIAMPEASKAEASSKAESPEELKPDNKK